MADAGSFNADLGLNLNLSLDNAGVAKVTNTLKEIAKGKDLQRYWKDVETATDNATKAMERYSRNTSSSKLAERFLKEINALKAISGNENLSKLFPKIDLNIDGLIESAKKIAPTINSEFSISNFSSAFKTFDLLKEQGLDLTDVFRKLSEYAELVSKNIDLKRENSSYRELLGDKDIQSVQNYQNALEKLRKEAEEIFESFLKVNHISRTDFWGDEKFGEYFSSIKEGTMTATEAISTFKAEYSYLLKGDSTKNGFGLDALQEFSTKLTNILREVEDVSTKINDILSNGVITKSMQNLSMDSTLSDSQRSLFSNLLKDEETLKTITSLFQNLIEESNKTRNATLFDEEQFSRLLILFEKIESSLSSMKAVFVDVGDGEEFSPLLKMINNVQESVGKLSSSAKNIGLNMNIDVGSNKELETRFQEKASKALIAYQRLFDHIKSTTTSQSIFEEFNKFNLDNFDTTYGKAKAIANFIERARNDSKTLYNNHDVLKEDTSSTYWKQASASMAQATKVLNEMRASSNVNPLENLFGKTDLTEVISQLNRIVEKLSEISSTASEFKNTFANGFNISASVEEIEKLTSRVKELENELSKVKISSTSPVKTNISSGNGVIKELETIDAKEDEIISKTQKMYRAFNSTHGVSGKGISWFTDELETAESYIESRGKDRIAQLVTDTNKFLTIDGNGSSFNKILYEGIERTTDELAEMAKQAGYAGIAINNIYDSFSGSTDIKPSNIFAIFDENIIKKATDVTETIRVEASIKNINSLISETNEKLELEKNNQKELNALLDDYNNGRKISPEDKNYIEDGTLQKSLEDSIKASETYERKLESLNSELSKLQSSTPIKDTFQGDKIQEATTSARELDRTLEQVDIPKDSFDEVINKLKLAEIKAEDIVKITKQMRIGEDGKPIESYTLKDKYGSTEIYGVSSNKEKGQLLSANYVQYDVKQAEKLQKDFNKAYEEATKINNALTETKGKLDGLSKHPELSSQFSEVENTIKSLNAQLTQGEISVSEYNKAVKETTSNYSKLVGIQQKRDTETYNANAKQARDEAKALEQAVKQAQKLAEEKRKARQADKQATQSSVDKALKDQLDAWEAIQKIRLQIAQTDSKDTEKLHNLNEQKKALQKQYNEAGKVLKANKDLYNQTEQQVKLEHERLETNEKINKLKLNNVDVGSVLSKGDSDLKKFEARKNQSEEYRSTVEKLKQSIEELRVLEQSMVKSKLLPDGEAQKINEAVASIEEYTNAIKNMPAVEKGSDEGSRTKLANRIHEYMDKNTRMTREFREEFENLIRVLRSGDDSVNIKDIARQFEDVKFRVKEAKQEGISFFDIFKNKAVYGFAARLAQYYLSFYDFIRYARYAVQSVIEFDTALTEMRKVSDESISTLERLQKATFNLADGVGTTALELQKSIADFMRIGESLEDATKSAQDANVLFRVSEFDDVTQATDALVAMSAAYKDLEKSQINDVLNEIGNNYAISTDELASALQKSAATLSVAGNDIYEAAALVTAGNTVLQDADSVGTGLKMISLRILGTQEAKDELASLGENVDDFVVQTKSKIDQTVRNYTAVTSNGFKGISVLDDNGNYRSTYEILRDISDVYQEIIETDKKAGTNRGQALLEVLAGKNRSNVAASILQSPEILESAYESALNSAGSAQEELNKYLESADGKVQKLKNKLQEFWNVLLDSGTLKTIIGSLTTILEKATELVDTFGTLGTAGLGLGAFLGIKNIGREKCYPSSNMPIVI